MLFNLTLNTIYYLIQYNSKQFNHHTFTQTRNGKKENLIVYSNRRQEAENCYLQQKKERPHQEGHGVLITVQLGCAHGILQ